MPFPADVAEFVPLFPCLGRMLISSNEMASATGEWLLCLSLLSFAVVYFSLQTNISRRDES
jgi:hypothetical protein